MCGCSLGCGIVTLGVFKAIGFVSAISTGNMGAIATDLAYNIPLILLCIFKDKWGVRQLNYIWELIAFILMCVGLIAATIFCEIIL